MLRQVSPAIAAWALSLGVVLFGARRQDVAPRVARSSDSLSFRLLLRYLVVLAAGGYVVLLGITLVLGVWLVGLGPSAMESAATGGLILAAIAIPVFVLLSWAEAIHRSRAGPP